MLSPCLRICHSSPGRVGLSRSTRPSGDTADRKPCGCSSASAAAVNPSSARRAETSPACDARPAWNGFVIVPKLAMMPPACDADSAIAIVAWLGVEAAQRGAGGARSDRAENAGRVPALGVMVAGIAARQLGPGLVTGDIGREHLAPAEPQGLGFGEDRRHQHGRDVAAAADIVVIERMAGGAVDPRRFRRGGALAREIQAGRSPRRAGARPRRSSCGAGSLAPAIIVAIVSIKPVRATSTASRGRFSKVRPDANRPRSWVSGIAIPPTIAISAYRFGRGRSMRGAIWRGAHTARRP